MPSSFSVLLRPLGLLYKGIVQSRNTLFDWRVLRSWKSPVPVVSIGNLSVGGTGKTPIVDWITKYYLSVGVRPALISRGYRRESKGVQLVSDGRKILLGSRESGDETAMLAWNNQDAVVLVAEKRKKGVRRLVRQFREQLPAVIILDDAFQHRQIERELNIAVINAEEPYFDARMMPEGRLREPMANLERADLVILNKIANAEKAAPIVADLEKKGKKVVQARLKTAELVCMSGAFCTQEEAVRKQSISAFAFAGIARPEGFIESLQQEGIHVADYTFFKDHEPYTERMLRKIERKASEQGLSLVTTEKDYFRLLGRPELIRILTSRPCYYLRIGIDFFAGRETLVTMLDSVVGRQNRIIEESSTLPSRFSKWT